MLLRVCAFFLLLLWVNGCREQPTDTAKKTGGLDTFSVAFYNVENLFDDEFDGNEYPEYRPNATNWNKEMHAKKMDNSASVIAALHATVIALCEVEDRDALQQLSDVLKKKSCLYPYRMIIDTPAISNTNPALLSRFPISKVTQHPITLPEHQSTRGVLEATIDVRGTPLVLFVNHWPSKHHPESFRIAAADTLMSLIGQLPKGTDYIIAGDFNSDYNEFATFTTAGLDNTGGVTGINHRLKTVHAVTPITTRVCTKDEVIAATTTPLHYDLWMELPDPVRMSYVYKGNNQTPDHLLIPAALFDTSGIAYIDNSFASFTWGSRLLSNGKPVGWKMRYAGEQKFHVGEGYSDHLPIVARFVRGAFKRGTAAIDFNDAFTADSGNPDSWFEYHTSGWISEDNQVTMVRDTSPTPVSGRYSLHASAPEHKENFTALAAVIPAAYRDKYGNLPFFIRGTGSICFRTKNREGKWRYLDFSKGSMSGRATYVPFSSEIWQTITIPSDCASGLPVTIELRSGKQSPLDLWIDR